MSSIRVKFVRGEEVKYISHLDLMKMFERAVRRSNIPIAYSQGFNPHPHIVFGLPLSVGVTSDSEYADFELEKDMKPEEFAQRLNQNLPEGVKIVEAKKNNTNSNIMAQVAGALYEVLVLADGKVEIEDLKSKLSKFLENKEIFTEKESKGKIKSVDIRPMIYNVAVTTVKNTEAGVLESTKTDFTEDGCKNLWILKYVEKLKAEDDLFKQTDESAVFCFTMLLAAGSMANLKPEFVIAAFGRYSGINFEILKIHRSGLFTKNKDNLTDPLGGRVLLSV